MEIAAKISITKIEENMPDTSYALPLAGHLVYTIVYTSWAITFVVILYRIWR
jgi:hypothetical protein